MNVSNRVKGYLDPVWQEWLEGLQIVHEADGTTRITGPLQDQPALYGILTKIHHLSLTLLSLECSELSHTTSKGGVMHETFDQMRERQVTGSHAPGLTRVLLICGLIAGPFYLVVSLIQALIRPGFDLLRHDLSLLANGPFGWVQITNLVLTGLLVLAFSVGLRRGLPAGPGRIWGPILLGIYGIGLIGAGFFTADPAFGFPPGTPANAHAISWHGLLHIVTAGIGFLGLIAACFVLARRFASRRQRGGAAFSLATGVIFFAAFAGVAAGSGQTWSVIGFWIGVVLAWV